MPIELNTLDDDTFFLSKNEAPSCIEDLKTQFSSSMSLKDIDLEYNCFDIAKMTRKRNSIFEILSKNQIDHFETPQ